ncbi:MAG: RsmB/NOP family class I SAM-dependent RNA methyltransferase [Humidesulfovibrio sp.]|nr:RsmB/NOP family class I SAM-dependent RNA methyltransferase [Humidesulfovibrio sp.]
MQTRTFRITTTPDQRPLVEALLAAQGFAFSPEPFFAAARRLEREPFPLGSSLAASFGLIYIQDRSSMLPPVLLDARAGSRCLDMCASPGGKTGILAGLVGPEGFVLAAEASRDRLATLRQNLRRMGAVNAATIGVESQHLALAPGSFDAILLDPPCSGWGTVDKNPRVLEVWTPEKAETLVRLQRLLLARAAELLKPGGRLMYSTCTTNIRENEEQVAWALERLPLKIDALPEPEGFAPVPLALTGLDGVLRVGCQDQRWGEEPGGNGQGFFLARFQHDARDAQEVTPSGEDLAPLGGQALTARERAEALAAGVNLVALPPGEVRAFGGKAYFLHQAALDLCEMAGLGSGGQRWQGFLLGQMQGGRFAAAARTRMLMPQAAELSASRRLDVDEPAAILDLLAGRSLEFGAGPERKRGDKDGGGLVGLYFRGLPLGWLTRKGRRLLWSDR